MRKSTRFFVNSSPKKAVYLFGGVLSMLAFALISNPVSAYTNSYNTFDSSSYGTFHSNLRGACLFENYSNVYWSDRFVGDLSLGGKSADGSDMCSYRIINGAFSYYPSSSNGTVSSVNTAGSLSTPTISGDGGYNPANWSSSDSENYGGSVRSTIYKSGYVVNSSYSSDIIIPSSADTGVSNQRVMFFYRFAQDASVWIHPAIDPDNSTIYIYDSNGSVSGSDYSTAKDTFIHNTNLTLNITCGSDDTENLFPSIHNYDFSANPNECYIVGSFYVHPTYSFHIRHLVFMPADSSYYSVSSSSLTFDKDIAFNYLAQNPSTYRGANANNETWYSPFLNFHPLLYVLQCDDSTECSSWEDIENNQIYAHNSGSQDFPDYNPDNNGSSVFMSWFNIFNFGFLFPFSNFFNALTGSQSCVDVPIIGSMLSNPNARYCSWWSNDIRSVLTPVFSIFSIMIIFGFLMSFLKGHSDPLSTPTNSGKGVWNYKDSDGWHYGGDV